MIDERKFNKWFNVFILVGMTVCVILSSLNKMRTPDVRTVLIAVSAFGAVMGVASTILSANGSIWTFLFGLVDVCIYSCILYDSKMPTQFLLHVLFFIPMEFIGFFQWKKRGASSGTKVKARRMDASKTLQYATLFVLVLGVSAAVSWLISFMGAETVDFKKIILDALVTTANIVALVMMAFAYMEQWYLWTLVNIASICIWTVTLMTRPDASYAMIPLVKYSFYLLNGLNGIRIWWNLSKTDNKQQRS